MFILTLFYLYKNVGERERTVGFWTLYSLVEDFILPLRKGFAKMNILRTKMEDGGKGMVIFPCFPNLKCVEVSTPNVYIEIKMIMLSDFCLSLEIKYSGAGKEQPGSKEHKGECAQTWQTLRVYN